MKHVFLSEQHEALKTLHMKRILTQDVKLNHRWFGWVHTIGGIAPILTTVVTWQAWESEVAVTCPVLQCGAIRSNPGHVGGGVTINCTDQNHVVTFPNRQSRHSGLDIFRGICKKKKKAMAQPPPCGCFLLAWKKKRLRQPKNYDHT